MGDVPGSFRDPASRVVIDDDRVIRVLDQRGLASWNALHKSAFFDGAVEAKRLIPTEQLDSPPPGAVGALEHPRLPFISYPYEWTFHMLKDAALLQLDLLAAALESGMTIKDATPFNIQFVEGRPMFIDIGSFEPYRAGEPWIGYRQFTRQFLFPLMLRAWADIPFQPWLRGDMDGPTAAQMKQILPWSKRRKPSVMAHISLQAKMEERFKGEAVRDDLRSAGFSTDLILANVSKLCALVESLEWDHGEEGWSEYHTYDHVDRDRDAKAGFLSRALEDHAPGRVLDLGANDGYFTMLAASTNALGIAIDGFEPVLDAFYRHTAGESISIVCSDLANPSPSQGWAGTERPALMDRAAPDLVIAYGLIHHLIYSASVPPAHVVRWLAGFRCPVVVEFVDPSDEMVSKLTANKLDEELHQGRSETEFRSLIAERFEVAAELTLEGGTRILFRLRPL